MAITRALFCIAIATALDGCASAPPVPFTPPTAGVELISIENEPGPFCGRCDHIKATALSDGRVWIEHGYWEGRYRHWRVVKWIEQTKAENFNRFRDHLHPYRLRGETALNDKPPCQEFWNDVDGARVEWRDSSGTDKLIYNFGCDPESRKSMAAAIREAPGLLSVPSLKMPWGQWVATTPS